MSDITAFPIATNTVASLPDLGTVTDDSSFVGEHGGTGRFGATSLRSYLLSTAATLYLPLSGGTLTGALTGTTITGTAFTGTNLAVSGNAPVDDLAMHDIGSFMLNGASSTTEFQFSHPGHYSTEALAAGIVVPAGSSGYTANAFGAYVRNDSTLAAGASAAYFYGRNTVAGGTVFGTNVLVTDQTNVGTAGVQSTVVGAEWDIGAFNTNSHAIGQNLIGVFPNGTPVQAVGYQLSVLNSPWGYGFLTGDGAAQNGIWLGAKAGTANSDGQPIVLTARDNANSSHSISVQAAHAAAGANLALSVTQGAIIANTSTGAQLVVAASGSAANLIAFAYGTTAVGSITTDGASTVYNTASDYRLKVTYGVSDGALIDDLVVYEAEFKSHPGVRYPMVLAHEVQAVAPWAVTGEKDAVDEQGNIVPQMVDAIKVFWALVAKVQTLEARLAVLEDV